MKKIFLLLPALVLALAMNAAVINITPTSPYDEHDNLRLALYYAQAGDEIVLADGTYDEHDDYLYFNKDITVRAAEGAHPVIDMYTYAQIKTDANVTIDGLKFNGAAQGSYSYYFRFYDATHTKLYLNNCEFYSVKNYVIFGNSASHTDECNVNNCYFHNNVKNAIYFEASETEGVQTCDKLVFTNSTVANTAALTNYTSTIDIRPYGSSVTDAIKVIVDHCTFYNNPTINSDHSAIRPYKLSDVTITNCIFAHPEAYDRRATSCYGGSVSNCLTYNLTYDAGRNGHRQDGGQPVLSDNITAGPLFVDEANGDFTLNYASKARRLDGSVYGDPRWAKAIEAIEIPAKLNPLDAFVSEKAWVEDAAVDSLLFAPKGSEGYASDADYTIDGSQYAKWNVKVMKAGKYQFVASTSNYSGHNYRLMVYNEDETVMKDMVQEAASDTYNWSNQDGSEWKVSSNVLDLEAGNYVIKIQNKKDSKGRVLHIAANYLGGATTALPGQLLGEDALLYKTGSKYMIRTEEGYLKSSNNGTPTSEWAVWNITATAGTMNVTLNLDPVTSSGHNYRVELYSGEELKDYSEEMASAGLTDAVHTKGNIALEKTLVVPADGNYTIKLINRTQWSSMILQGITFTTYVEPVPVMVSENDADNSAWVDKVGQDPELVQIDRTILAGMYNTLCLPFPVSSTQCKAVFGNDVELLTFAEATISGDILTLSFNEADDIYQGTPMLIKTSANVVSPTFNNVQFLAEGPDATHGTAADFRGIFFPKELNANRDLFVGQNNQVYFPSNSNKLKGLRAYFHLDSSLAPIVKHARIVAQGNVITEIDLVNGENEGVIKTIENGQLVIMLDGIRYNVMGTQIK